MTNRRRQTNHEVVKEKVDEFEMMKNINDDEGKIFRKTLISYDGEHSSEIMQRLRQKLLELSYHN